jgi:putative membrane protein
MDRLRIGTAMMAFGLLAFGLLSATAAIAPALGQDNPARPPAAGQAAAPAQPRLSKGDRNFVDAAAQSGLAEVELGKLAQKSVNPDVRRFADRMITDHTKADLRLKAIADADGVAAPDTLDFEHRKLRDKLANEHDGNFDRDYARAMVADHDQATTLFRKEEESGRDAELQAFARNTLPILQEHRKMAATLAAKLGATAAR